MELYKKMEIHTGGLRPGFFTPAQALAAFNADFLDADTCRLWILERIHGKTATCSKCGVPVTPGQLARFWTGGRLKCQFCSCLFSATSRTFLAGCHFIEKMALDPVPTAKKKKGASDFRALFLLAILLAPGLDNNQIAAAVNVDPGTIRLWRHRFSGLDQIHSQKIFIL